MTGLAAALLNRARGALSQTLARAQPELAGVALALGLAGRAQWLADARQRGVYALWLYLAAALLYVLSTWDKSSPAHSPSPPSRLCIRVPHLLLGLGAALLAYATLGHNHFTLAGAVAWVSGMLLCLSALQRPALSSQRHPKLALSSPLFVSWSTWALLGAVLVGAWLRFHRLLELPADLGWDLPYNYSDTKRILNDEYLIFFPDNMGREGMFFYLAAAVARLGHLSPYSIRITSALVGVAAIPAIYLLAAECADRESGLYAAWLLALNKWHLVLTRSGYRVSLMPLFTILALYGLARGLRRGHARDWGWCGLFTGLGLWTYKAFVFVPLILLGCASLYALLALRKRCAASGVGDSCWATSPRAILRGCFLWLLVTLVAATPMLRFVVDSPALYLARERHGLALVSESATGLSRWRLLRQSIVTSLLMFNYMGDAGTRFGVPYQRHLGFISGLLFVLGAASALATPRRRGHALLVVAVFSLLVPMTVSMLPGEAPNCFRSSGTIGPALVLAALALRRVRAALTRGLARILPCTVVLSLHAGDGSQPRSARLRVGRHLGLLVPLAVGLFVAGEWRETERFYFTDFRLVAPDVANYSVALEMAQTIMDFEGGSAFVVTWPHWYDGRALAAHLESARAPVPTELQRVAADQPPLDSLQGQALFVVHPDDVESLELLKAFFPRYAYTAAHFPDGRSAYIAFYGEKE